MIGHGTDFAKVLQGVVSARFGPGVLGRIGTMVVGPIVVLAVIACVAAFFNPYVSAGIAVLIALIILYALHRAFNYAEAHPELSAMDGAQIHKLLTHQAAMKPIDGVEPPPVIVGELVQNPTVEEEPR